jgi:P-type Cu+ transporter
MMKKNIRINGMHCAGCVNSVEKVLRNVEGVQKADVQLTTETAQIETEGDTFPMNQIRKAVEQAGFEVEEDSTESLTMQIGGMTCSGCSSAVEKAIARLDGVQSVNVNLPAEKAFVEYDPAQTAPDQIAEAVENAGYEVTRQKKNLKTG